eukprot:TRINITY_DN24422_c0_g1_i6.p1 TRINITY_DN24422_c0_g1~~TRINITY_DN24422_c0_g1_i6.p1  ORF type:complete len:441 (+),score=59.80 TRINITY_DN24422_c0_g1_i6:86-1408(+)
MKYGSGTRVALASIALGSVLVVADLPVDIPQPNALRVGDFEEAFIIGDLHGDLQCAKQWVSSTGLVDLDTMSWTGSKTQALVFMGDYIDKGPYGRQVMEFVRNLTDTFPRNTVALLGNHDLYFLSDSVLKEGAAPLMGVPVRDFSYAFTHPEEYLNWIPVEDQQEEDSSVVLPALFAAFQFVYEKNLHNQVMMSPAGGHRSLFDTAPTFKSNKKLAERVQKRLQEWQVHMKNGLATSGLGEWLRARPLVTVVGGAVLVHGGLRSEDLRLLEASRKKDTKTLAEALEFATTDTFRDLWSHGSIPEEEARRLQHINEAVTYRGFHSGRHGGPDACMEVTRVLKLLAADTGASLVVVGHTPGDSVRIECKGKLAAVDSSLSRYFRAYGNLYCPLEVGIPVPAGSACDTPVSRTCEGQISHLYKIDKGAWAVEPLSLGGERAEL